MHNAGTGVFDQQDPHMGIDRVPHKISSLGSLLFNDEKIQLGSRCSSGAGRASPSEGLASFRELNHSNGRLDRLMICQANPWTKGAKLQVVSPSERLRSITNDTIRRIIRASGPRLLATARLALTIRRDTRICTDAADMEDEADASRSAYPRALEADCAGVLFGALRVLAWGGLVGATGLPGPRRGRVRDAAARRERLLRPRLPT